MFKKKWLAMLLAGGQGSRLGILTKKLAKPAVPFGGKYRIIDFSLSNCKNSGIDTIGILTQYKPLILNNYIGIGSAWYLDSNNGGVSILPPYMREKGGQWYKGTANAVYQNVDFIDFYQPKYVLIIAGDHVYKMNYAKMLEFHIQKRAEATIAFVEVNIKEANRFGIMKTDSAGRVVEFEEKPLAPKSNKASMGIYIFTWPLLKDLLKEDDEDISSSNDFGKDIIPRMVNKKQRVYGYHFSGYWRDVGTIESYYNANMDLLINNNYMNLLDDNFKIYYPSSSLPPLYISKEAKVNNSLVADGCCILGQVNNSIIFPGSIVGHNSVINNSIIMPHVTIKENCRIESSIIAEETVVNRDKSIGCMVTNEITVIDGVIS